MPQSFSLKLQVIVMKLPKTGTLVIKLEWSGLGKTFRLKRGRITHVENLTGLREFSGNIHLLSLPFRSCAREPPAWKATTISLCCFRRREFLIMLASLPFPTYKIYKKDLKAKGKMASLKSFLSVKHSCSVTLIPMMNQ